MYNIHSILKSYWGYDAFRPLQEDIIHSILNGKDTLALLPTGGGKSICFQVPAMAKEGLCLVVSPLIALMKDQVEALRKKHITAFAIFSGMSRKEVIQILQIAGEKNCKFLYVSPERLETRLFLEYLPSLPVNLIAVDEAHCISQWGYDFRPPYLRIAALREELPGIPLLALTASATSKVQQDIMDKLQFGKELIFRQSFARPNLSYSVLEADAKLPRLAGILRNVPGSSIVYCRSRKQTRQVAEQLASYQISADYYHAGLSAEERNNKQQQWIANKIRTIVCTNAFGMGIDKPDVRVVVHMDSPDCLENYYQEAGRAGRDRNKAYAVLLFQPQDLLQLKEQINIRFPELEQIRIVYQAVMNYLQIPSGSGEGNYYAFDLTDFLGRFKLEAALVVNSLKVMEQEGLLSFNEQVLLPSRVEFICNKEMLYEFEKSYPLLEPLIKTLLRSYEGIFDQPVNIHEKSLAYLTRKELSLVKQELFELDRHAIISYQPQKDSPQLFFMQNRIKAGDLRIDQLRYQQRKEDYSQRVSKMISYVKTNECRSRFTGSYFGDNDLPDCGVCDNCLLKKKTALQTEEFKIIQDRILKTVKETPMNATILIHHLKPVSQDKIWEVLAFLQSERKVSVTDTGIISLYK